MREVQHRAVAGLIFGLLALLALLLVGTNIHRGIYLVIFALVIGPVGGVLGISARRAARRGATMRPRGAIAAAILGAVTIVLGLSYLVGFTLFSAQLDQYSRCMTQAQTVSARNACISRLYRAVDGQIGTGSG